MKTLNPLVEIKVDTSNVESLPDSFFSQFALVCVSNKSLDALVCSPSLSFSFILSVLNFQCTGILSFFCSLSLCYSIRLNWMKYADH